MRVLVTGASGFVGRHLCAALIGAGHSVRAAVRGGLADAAMATQAIVVGDIDSKTRWDAALKEIDAVIHCAARTHVLNDSAANRDLYLETNARGTQTLARAAAEMGIRRFVYLSSVKVNGEGIHDYAYTRRDAPAPEDDYGASKLLGENYLREVAVNTGLTAAIVRPPLVYGPGVRANFLRLLRWVDAGWPIPLAAVQNRRSLVSVYNLCDLLAHLLVCELPSHSVWMVSDDEDVSTAELLQKIARSMNRRNSLVSVPVNMLSVASALLGRRSEFKRLCTSLTVDVRDTCCELQWRPPLSVDDGLARTAAWYRGAKRRE